MHDAFMFKVVVFISVKSFRFNSRYHFTFFAEQQLMLSPTKLRKKNNKHNDCHSERRSVQWLAIHDSGEFMLAL